MESFEFQKRKFEEEVDRYFVIGRKMKEEENK